MRTTRADKRKNINNYHSWVYGLYEDGRLIYVGVTADPSRRLGSHSEKKRFDEMRLIRGFSSRDRAEQYENVCIKTFSGLSNIVSLNPRPAGFKQVTPSISSYERKAWLSDTADDFDFDLLDNKSIQKRKKFGW